MSKVTFVFENDSEKADFLIRLLNEPDLDFLFSGYGDNILEAESVEVEVLYPVDND